MSSVMSPATMSTCPASRRSGSSRIMARFSGKSVCTSLGEGEAQDGAARQQRRGTDACMISTSRRVGGWAEVRRASQPHCIMVMVSGRFESVCTSLREGGAWGGAPCRSGHAERGGGSTATCTCMYEIGRGPRPRGWCLVHVHCMRLVRGAPGKGGGGACTSLAMARRDGRSEVGESAFLRPRSLRGLRGRQHDRVRSLSRPQTLGRGGGRGPREESREVPPHTHLTRKTRGAVAEPEVDTSADMAAADCLSRCAVQYLVPGALR